MESNKIRITVSGVLEDLSNGYTRTTSSKHYNSEIGSIEEKYGLNKTEVTELFKHPKLINKKTIIPKETRFIIVDDTEETTNEISENGQESLSTDNANDTITSEEQSEEELEEVPFNYEPSLSSSPLDLD